MAAEEDTITIAAEGESGAAEPQISIFGIPCCKPDPRPPAAAYDRMMTIQVVKNADGDASDTEGTEDFITYRGLLCHHSKYFEKLLTGSFKEGGATTYRVTTCTPEVFAMFYNWMNTGIASIRKGCASSGDNSRYMRLAVDLYVFADFHEITTLRNHAIEICCAFLFKLEEYEYIGEVYEKTPAGSVLRKLFVDLLVDNCDCEDFEKYLSNVKRADLFLDVIKVIKNKEGIVWAEYYQTLQKHFCERYHEHPAPT